MNIDIEKLIEDFKNNFIPNKKANIVKMSELLQALEQQQAEIEKLKTHVLLLKSDITELEDENDSLRLPEPPEVKS